MKTPTHAILLLDKNIKYPIEKIHYKTQQVTLREKSNVYNTASIKNVIFDFSDFTPDEIQKFLQKLYYISENPNVLSDTITELELNGFEVFSRADNLRHSLIIRIEKKCNNKIYCIEKAISYKKLYCLKSDPDFICSNTLENAANELQEKILQEKENNNVKN